MTGHTPNYNITQRAGADAIRTRGNGATRELRQQKAAITPSRSLCVFLKQVAGVGEVEF